ncbi:MAG: hypothetical protein TREMPRED_001205 [Tremellales sp. Tagirdzhanova-0007]|nr:MAG: hypothetical protein TREMPRED_001205 [Tremellales sp. Tagirdzhanova-0007]
MNGINRRYCLCYLGLSLIGIGSTGFHACLRWEWQLLDELPMIYVVSWSAYLCFDTLPSFKPRFGNFGYAAVLFWCIFVTFSYLYLPNPIYHQIAFAFILISAVVRNIFLIQRVPQGHPIIAHVTRTMAWGVLTFAGGFTIWNIDNIFCTQLRAVRESIGWMGFLLEGHGIWHLMTGYGAFLIFTAAIYLNLAVKVSPEAYTFDSHVYLPLVYPVLPAVSEENKSNREKT